MGVWVYGCMASTAASLHPYTCTRGGESETDVLHLHLPRVNYLGPCILSNILAHACMRTFNKYVLHVPSFRPSIPSIDTCIHTHTLSLSSLSLSLSFTLSLSLSLSHSLTHSLTLTHTHTLTHTPLAATLNDGKRSKVHVMLALGVILPLGHVRREVRHQNVRHV